MNNNRCEDSSKAKQVEEALRTSLENYRYLVKYAPTGIYEIDFATGKFLHVNDAMCQYLGYTEKELLTSVSAFDILDKESIELFKERIKKILAGAKIDENVEYRGKTKDGRIFWTMLNVKLIFRDNKPQGALVVAQDITERKKAEEEIKKLLSNVEQERDRYNLLLNSIPDEVWFADKNKKISLANPQAIKEFGLNTLGTNEVEKIAAGFEVYRSDGSPRPVEEAPTLRALKGEVIKNEEEIVKIPVREELRYRQVNAVPVRDKNGDILGSISIVRDITEQKKAEKALKESEELYKNFFENTDDAFQLDQVLFDKNDKPYDWVFLDVNQAFEQQTGLKKAQVLGKRAKADVIPNIENYWLSALGRVAKTGKAEHIENYNKDTDRWYDDLIIKYREEAVGILFRDITQRKKMEQQLKQRTEQLTMERERFFNILEDMPVMVCLITADYKIAFSNRMFREKFGEAKGRCCYEYVGCVNAPCGQCQSLIPLQTGRPHHWTANFPDGTVVDAHDFPFTDVDGTRMVIEADIDITERVNLQKQLQEKERLAAIGATAGMVGHDIRNPLQAITGDVYLLKDFLSSMPDMQMKKDVAESLDSIENNVEYINKIVQDLQDYTRTLYPQKIKVKLEDICREVLYKRAIPQNVVASCAIQEEVKELYSDPAFLKRILANLVNNAVQAMPQGGEIIIQARKEANNVMITVKDTGVGIPEDIKGKLFTPMFTTKSKGQGFGLAVVKRMTEALGGTVSFESQVGKGTKFIIELPITQ